MERSKVAHAQLQSRATMPAPRCPYRLGEVTDRRAGADAAGSIGNTAFSVEDVATLVRGRLAGHGLAAEPGAPELDVEIHQLYLAQNQTTKVPVAVYRASVDDESPWVIRSQVPSMNWVGSDEEGMRAITRALDDADARLLQLLDDRCG